jgi:hypothetical protein
MSQEDWELVLMMLGAATAHEIFPLRTSLALVNRLNEGNPHYRPYEVGAKEVKFIKTADSSR